MAARQIRRDGVEWKVQQMVLKHCKVGLTNFAMFVRRSGKRVTLAIHFEGRVRSRSSTPHAKGCSMKGSVV